MKIKDKVDRLLKSGHSNKFIHAKLGFCSVSISLRRKILRLPKVSFLKDCPNPKDERINPILEMKRSGKTYQQIGKAFKVSRQCIQQLVMKHSVKYLKSACEHCGRSDVKLHGHHEFYEIGESVKTLCVPCHSRFYHLCKTKITSEVIQRIKNGATNREISAEFNISSHMACCARRRFSLPRDPNFPKRNMEFSDRIVKLRSDGLSLSKIAKLVGRCPTRIGQILAASRR